MGLKRIYVTEEAYKMLVHYCLSKRKSLRGITKEASQLLIEAISQKLGAGGSREYEDREG
jgi:hypothetical protein